MPRQHKDLTPWAVPEIRTKEEYFRAVSDLLHDAQCAQDLGDTIIIREDGERIQALAQAYPAYAQRLGEIVLLDSDN